MSDISGADLLAMRSQAATADDYATICRNNIDRLTQAYLALQVENVQLRCDAARLDFLDRNAKFKMGWHVGTAPAGNLSVSSVAQLGKPVTGVREAIDAAMGEPK